MTRSICMMLQKNNNTLKLHFINLVRWPAGCLIFFMTACKESTGYKSFIMTRQDSLQQQAIINHALVRIKQLKSQVSTGDLVTRTGNDFTSETLRNLNRRNNTFSHCGIASIENDSVFVYHALGGDFNPDQKIVRDRFEDFAEPYSNKGIGIFRFNLPRNTLNGFAQNARDLYEQGIMFDMDFNLQTDDRMYCAEFVYKCFLKNTRWNEPFNRSHLKKFEFIGVDDLFLHPLCKIQAQLLYDKNLLK